MFRQFFGNMNRKIILFLGVDYFDSLEFADQHTGITYLTTTFCIERSVVQYNLIQSLVFLFDLTVTKNRSFVLSVVISDKFGCSFSQSYPVTRLNGGGVTGTLFLLLHFFIELFDVDSHSVFTKNQFGQIQGETESII